MGAKRGGHIRVTAGAVCALALTGLFSGAPHALAAPAPGPAQAAAQVHASDAFAKATLGFTRKDGLLALYVDAKAGRVLALLPPDGQGTFGEYLYQTYMRSGIGSTPIGVDRSNPGRTRVLRFRRAGPRMAAELENFAFRADGGSADEAQAVRESFPPSQVWSGEILAFAPDGAALVDLTSFLTRDAFGVIDALKRADQGVFHLAEDRAFADVDGIGAFPDNLEFDAHETFVGDSPGRELQRLAPDPHAITLIEHQSLIRLPPPGFTPRLADPRTGTFSELVANYGASLDQPTVYRLAERFRLEKTDPTAARSTVKKPIVFYVDRAAPEPIRQALLDGARWWSKAFDDAGFIDAFKVDVLPPGVSPLDARYNIINWVHRQTRGWSYGYAVTDPRTGEIVKGSVLLGSLRVRQDRMIFEGLVGADKTGTGTPDDPIVISLARLRQLAVHETGHALGLAHNFAGSTYDDRASVMDYPPPRIGITPDGALDFSHAYQVGVGAWDAFAIKWLYSEVPAGAAGRADLERMVEDGYAHGLRYVRDEDARPTGSAQPYGALWDDGPDSVASLAHVMQVRRIALDHFGPGALPQGAPLSDLRRVIVPIYLFHRYEVDSVAKTIGGVDFAYGVRGGPVHEATPVDGARQRQALKALLATLDPAALSLPPHLIDTLSAGRDGAEDRAYDIEVFGDPQSPVFSLDAAVNAAADVTLANLLDPDRLARVAEQGARDPSQLSLDELLDAA
ncbi:MAG: zinc-dependent metalloprotease, partial [Alphaproteobacteria bacterium]|nr:zinc-dependent metalloprotease [Alphaproteobacteria bacterium]